MRLADTGSLEKQRDYNSCSSAVAASLIPARLSSRLNPIEVIKNG
jgi:hypothetical protein